MNKPFEQSRFFFSLPLTPQKDAGTKNLWQWNRVLSPRITTGGEASPDVACWLGAGCRMAFLGDVKAA